MMWCAKDMQTSRQLVTDKSQGYTVDKVCEPRRKAYNSQTVVKQFIKPACSTSTSCSITINLASVAALRRAALSAAEREITLYYYKQNPGFSECRRAETQERKA